MLHPFICPVCRLRACLPACCALQAVQMFIDEQIGYLDIIRLNEACCEAHKAELIAYPNLEEIVHYDQWARQWVKQHVESGAYKPKVVLAVK